MTHCFWPAAWQRTLDPLLGAHISCITHHQHLTNRTPLLHSYCTGSGLKYKIKPFSALVYKTIIFGWRHQIQGLKVTGSRFILICHLLNNFAPFLITLSASQHNAASQLLPVSMSIILIAISLLNNQPINIQQSPLGATISAWVWLVCDTSRWHSPASPSLLNNSSVGTVSEISVFPCTS